MSILILKPIVSYSENYNNTTFAEFAANFYRNVEEDTLEDWKDIATAFNSRLPVGTLENLSTVLVDTENNAH